MINVYIPTWEDDPHQAANPFVYTLVDDIKTYHNDIQFHFGLDLLWSDECLSMDCIHVMWPHCFAEAMERGLNLENRIAELKKHNVTIITTCHNLKPHITTNNYANQAYDLFYKYSNIIIHLGRYSLELFQKLYPHASHTLIPHHVYDRIYKSRAGKNESCIRLHLNPKKRYILCFGAFRTTKEKEMVRLLSRKLFLYGIRVIAPSYLIFPSNEKNFRSWRRPLYEYIRAKMSGLIVQGQRVSDEDLKYYYGCADVCFIQRPDILNSGNLPLGMYMGKVIVGPNVGNVGQILKDTSNLTFDPHDFHSVIDSVRNGLLLAKNNKGVENYQYCMANLTTHAVANSHYNIYKTCSRNEI